MYAKQVAQKITESKNSLEVDKYKTEKKKTKKKP